MKTPSLLTAGLLASALGLACEDSVDAPPQIPTDELAELVLFSDDILGDVLTQQGLSGDAGVLLPLQDVIVTDASFSRTRSCPAGGLVSWEGTAHREYDTETETMTASFAGARSKEACAFERGEFTITVDGAAEWTHERRRVSGQFDGLQTSTHSGSFTALRSDGAERSCSFDVEIIRDPAAGTVTISGTLCREIVQRIRSWAA